MTPFRDDQRATIEAAELESARLRALEAQAETRNAAEVAAFDARARKVKRTGPTVAFVVVAVIVVGVFAAAATLYVILRIADSVVPNHG